MKKVMQAPELPASMRKKRKPKPQAPTLPKQNPTLKYILRIQKSPHGPVLTWNGKSFSDRSEMYPKTFSREIDVKRKAKKLLKQFDILSDYKMWIDAKFRDIQSKTQKQKHRAMRGGSRGVNPSKRVDAELDEAAQKLQDFSGHSVGHLESAYSRSSQKTGLIVGELDLIGYRAKRDGKTERYGHHFKKNSRPLLAVTSDGKQLHIVGGQYEFTEAGIEDR